MREMQETQFLSLDQKDLIEEKTATHSSSYLENPMNRGAWRAIVHGVTKSWRRLKQLSVHARIRPQTTKLLENIGRTASDIKCDNIFLVPYPKAKEIKAKITQMGPN